MNQPAIVHHTALHHTATTHQNSNCTALHYIVDITELQDNVHTGYYYIHTSYFSRTCDSCEHIGHALTKYTNHVRNNIAAIITTISHC